ncbi:CotS family spore coat protein [Clostridium oryzae]|uniref:Spore coat protein I n=1 Tax=Clostridium oryzae TaxID=1450648 RepID=A0A1V4IHG7_9CLOT|nr:CotS family spore coat protein [Clostridium oryzae]OPJ59448.1 spore coat protein I [Clostridium oryzae]
MPYEAAKNDYNFLSESNLKKYVLSYYGLENGDITQIKFKDTDKQRAVFKVTYNDCLYCLKKVYFSQDELLFVYSAIEWLYHNNISVPRLLPTIDGNRYVVYNNMFFILTPWIDGEKCSYDNISNVLDASGTLAKLHTCTKHFKPIDGSKYKTGMEDMAVSMEKHFNQLLNCSNMAFNYKDRFSKTFLYYFDSLIPLAQKSYAIAAGINNKNLSVALCHMDYVNKNIIFDKSNTTWIIDFDKCRIDYCAHDISYFLRRLLKRDNTRWDNEIAINTLKCYEAIKPLNLDEYKYILAYLAFPQKYWKISKDYYNNISRCNKNSFLTLLNKAIEKSENHMEFIKSFQKYIENKFNCNI